MIRIVVEMYPHGNPDPLTRTVLGVAIVSNAGTGTVTRGNYKYTIFSKNKKFRYGSIKGFERRKKNVWWLLYYILKDAMWVQQGEKEV